MYPKNMRACRLAVTITTARKMVIMEMVDVNHIINLMEKNHMVNLLIINLITISLIIVIIHIVIRVILVRMIMLIKQKINMNQKSWAESQDSAFLALLILE